MMIMLEIGKYERSPSLQPQLASTRLLLENLNGVTILKFRR